jgi:hypothetical protein
MGAGSTLQGGEDFVIGVGQAGPNQPPNGVIAFWGYLGPAAPIPNPSTPQDRWRLYFNLNLTEYAEFKREDIVWFQQLAGSPVGGVGPIRGSIVWLKDTATVQFVRVANLSHQAAFLQGPITGIPGQQGMPGLGGAVAAGSAGCVSLSTPCAD